MEYRSCKQCGEIKPLTIEFFPRGKNKRDNVEKFYFYKSCKKCDNVRKKKDGQNYKKKNRKKLAGDQKIYHDNHKEQDAATKKIWYKDNKEDVKVRVKINIRKRRRSDPIFKLRYLVSASIWGALNGNNSSKNGESCWKYLPYTVEELRENIEGKFEPWMTWENQGKYELSKWNDDDPTTWVWNLDHIIPHSTFNYTSMSDQAFQDCWALSNLRPLSAKINQLDGATRIRHKK
jgi:hypothetical protein